MIKRLIVLGFLLGLNSLSAQRIASDMTMNNSEFKTVALDQSHKNVYYDYTSVSDITNKSKKKNAQVILQIGKQYSKFSDENALAFDSINRIFSTKLTLDANDLNLLLPHRRKIKYNQVILRNNATTNQTIYSKVYSHNYVFTEPKAQFNWVLTAGEKEIMGYPCKQAKLEFKGRNWTAWYTEEIPISSGPYVFGGLPGLILEMVDADEHHFFKANKIDQITKELYVHQENDILKISKDEFLKVEKSYHDNPQQVVGKVYTSPGIVDQTPIKSLPYNPIELTM